MGDASITVQENGDLLFQKWHMDFEGQDGFSMEDACLEIILWLLRQHLAKMTAANVVKSLST